MHTTYNIRSVAQTGGVVCYIGEQALKKEFPWLDTDNKIALGSFSRRQEGLFDPWEFVQAMKRKASRTHII